MRPSTSKTSLGNPRDAEAAGVRTGDSIELVVDATAVRIGVRLDDGVAAGSVYVPRYYDGGAVMALADNMGGTAAVANLPEGFITSTIESKTNFFAGIALGDTAHAECTPLHRGRTTSVWQTRITRGDGKLAAIVTQTQIVMKKSG